MKLSRYLLIVLMLVAPAFCQEPTASSLAQKVDHYYDHLHSLKVHFAETYAGIGTSRTEEGTLLLSKPSEMRWDYEQPTRKLFLIDGKFAYFYVLGDNKAEKIEAKKLDDLRSPLRFLLGKTHLESEMNNLHLTRSAPTDFDLEGIPKGMENRVSRVTITATPTGQILALRIEERDGAVTTFKFSDFDTAPKLGPEAFRFEPPTGVTVVQGSLH